MVNPDDLIEKRSRKTLVNFDKNSLKDEARDESLRHRRLFRKDKYDRRPDDVYLPILIVPGVASSGLYVKKSSIDEKFVDQRVWMNAAFLAMARLNKKEIILEENEDEEEKVEVDTQTEDNDENKKKSCFGCFKRPFKSKREGKLTVATLKEKIETRTQELKEQGKDALTNLTDIVHGNDLDESDEDLQEFGKVEEDIAVKNTWIQHIALDTNMIDEKPGNEVRCYDGLEGCEYLVDSAVEKAAGAVMAPLVDYCVDVLHYERGKSIDAVPYDWRLAPSINEKRDGYLTNVIERVERMFEENDGLPILLLCHSMGAKMGHYFLNFALQKKGQEWLDKYVHTWMPVGAPHLGVGCAVRCGITGAGLNETVDLLVGNVADGLIMYRSWSCGNWLMPRMLPKEVFPTCIVRREGELGLTLTSEIEVGSLFAGRDKLPKELRLTVIFRDKINVHTEYSPLVTNEENGKVTVSFDETFYLAVPDIGNEDEIGQLIFYLEEPAGRVAQNKSELGKQFSHATRWARGLKKRAAAFARNFAKKWGTVLRVAVCRNPMTLKISDFETEASEASTPGGLELSTDIEIVGCNGGAEAEEIIEYSDSEDEEEHNISRTLFGFMHSEHDHDPPVGTISLKLSYTPPLQPTGTQPSSTPIAMTHEESPSPMVTSKRHKFNTISHDLVKYDVWNGTDVYKADGFVDPMFELVKNQYEGDPIGPTTKSSVDAPPVNCVRSIYGINVPTEAGAVYRKVPVVTVGDREADCRYMLDTSASFPPASALGGTNASDWNKVNLHTYDIKGGIIYETPETLQKIPGKDEARAVCGDGTVPYWNMVHALSWKDDVDTLTVDELEGAGHREVVMDERFFALVRRYAKVVDPRKNAMKLMKRNFNDTSGGIGTLAMSVDDLNI